MTALADLLNSWLNVVGGAALVITAASVVSAYNHWRARQYLREIRDHLQKQKVKT